MPIADESQHAEGPYDVSMTVNGVHWKVLGVPWSDVFFFVRRRIAEAPDGVEKFVVIDRSRRH